MHGRPGTPSGAGRATDGELYGTTTAAGAYGGGTVFKITPSGTLTTLYSFCSQSVCADGDPVAGLVQAANGDFYGTTEFGGANGQGTVFKITSSGTLTTLYGFCSQSGCPDGAYPYAGLVKANGGDLYGTTFYGGANLGVSSQGSGTIFRVTPSGALTTLYSFCSQSRCTDGTELYAGLTQDTNGDFYGTTYRGGSNTIGTVFSLSVGLVPFVKTQPASGRAGAVVEILGTNLTGLTSVSFNGPPAAITSASASAILTSVPGGATTGKVEVTTPGGTLLSNVPFRVLP